MLETMEELPWEAHSYRNRHGRGIRRPPFGLKLPTYRTASGNFDNQITLVVSRLKRYKPELFHNVECAVEDVPPSQPLAWEDNHVSLSQGFRAIHGIPARIALYRKPIELRSHDRIELYFIIRHEIIRQLAYLHEINPEDIDPSWQGDF